jgi:large subunit ribosomal protein L47
MARIKYVINERRLAYEGAMKIHAEKVEQAAKENETEMERVDSPVHQESEAQKTSPPSSEAAVDSLLQRSTT